MNDTSVPPIAAEKPPRNPWKIFGIAVICCFIAIASVLAIKHYLFPDHFTPVSLSERETRRLNEKLERLHLPTLSNGNDSSVLTPEPYSEKNANREVSFSEREVNAFIAHNTDLADKLAIDFSDNLASAKLLMPLDPDFPMLGGKTLKLSAGVEIAFRNGRPIVKLRGVSAWGVPVPNAWLGNLKNVDLISEFGSSGGVWQAFADGVEYIQVSDGRLVVKLTP